MNGNPDGIALTWFDMELHLAALNQKIDLFMLFLCCFYDFYVSDGFRWSCVVFIRLIYWNHLKKKKTETLKTNDEKSLCLKDGWNFAETMLFQDVILDLYN